MVQNRLKTDRILLIWLVLTIIWNMVAQFTPIHHVSTIEGTAPSTANATTGSDEENSGDKTTFPDADIPDEQEESAEI